LRGCQPEVASYSTTQSGGTFHRAGRKRRSERIGGIAPGLRPGSNASALAIDDNSTMVVSLTLLAGKPVPGDNPILFERTQK